MRDQQLHKVSTDAELSDAIRQAFGHYSLERSPEEFVDSERPQRGHPRLTGRALAVAATAAAALIVATLSPGGGRDTPLGPAPAAFASWTPAPRPADPASLRTALVRCNKADPRGAELPVAATERRGDYTLVFRTDGARRAVCIAGPRTQLLSLPAPPKLPTGAARTERSGRFPIEEVVFPGPRNPLAEWVGLVVGRVAADVGAVEIRTPAGVTVTATVSRGYFVAWWPGTAADAAHATIRALRDDGRPAARFRLLRAAASFAGFARNPSAAGVLPAEASGPAGSGRAPIMTLLTPRDDLGREVVVDLGGSERADGVPGRCREFPTDDEWRAASPSLPPECRYPNE